jgi:gliding motility-associated-like protein
MAFRVLLSVLLLYTNVALQSQTKRVIVNTPTAMYELTGGGGTCDYAGIPDLCAGTNENIYSSALFNQTLYFISFLSNNLYSVQLGVPGSCRFLTKFPSSNPNAQFSSVNALTVDKNGILYGVENSDNNLFKYNPNTNESALLGKLPVSPGGDLVFYGDKLLLATAGRGLYEINMDDPAASTQYMSTGNFSFWGLISFPFDCKKNKVYGFAPGGVGTQLVELDLETKNMGAVVCELPIEVYDAASIVESGNTLGIWIDSILIKAPCTATGLTGDVNIISYSATPGDLKYNLNSGQENTTGEFQQLAKGNYQVRITNDIGCSRDTFFTIAQGMPGMTATGTNPLMCEMPNGSIFIDAFSNYPITVRVNNGLPQNNLRLNGLGAGVYNISVIDGGSCRSDSTITLRYERRPDFLGAITTSPTFCEGKSGSINVGINGDPAGVTASLNGGPYKPMAELRNLDKGNYRLSVLKAPDCFYDTLLQISKQIDPPPQVTFDITDQFCFENNGKVVIHATGAGSPFTYNLNNGNYFPRNSFDRLAPGTYSIGIRNSNFCFFDSSVEIKPYIKQPLNITVGKRDPTCAVINSGELRVNISGAEAPYFFKVNNKTYNSGETAFLPPGEYPIIILNSGQCEIDSTREELVLQYSSDCNRMSMPNVFSPNNDGNNDVFRPIHSPYITQVQLAIYNRYGQMIFRSSPEQPGWDGRLKGQPVNIGNYAWVLTYRDFNGQPQKMNGLVLVIR